jgi:hypothetical protein
MIKVNPDLCRKMAAPMYELSERIRNQDLSPGAGLPGFEHACYLFFMISIDYSLNIPRSSQQQPFVFYDSFLRKDILRIRGADVLWFGLRRMLEDYYQLYKSYDLITPRKMIELFKDNQSDLEGLLKAYLHANYPKKSAELWIKNAIKLVDFYDGDPRKVPLMLPKISSCESLFRRLSGQESPYPKFTGLTLDVDGPRKILNYLLISMIEWGYWKVEDPYALNVAVDINVARFSAITGLVKLSPGEQVALSEMYNYVREVFTIAFEECKKQKIINPSEEGIVGPYIFDSVGWSTPRDMCNLSPRPCKLCHLVSWCEKNAVNTDKDSTCLSVRRNS